MCLSTIIDYFSYNAQDYKQDLPSKLFITITDLNIDFLTL